MGEGQEAGTKRAGRRWRTLSEKRRIAELTFDPGASVALVARAHGVNASQVFKWRRALKRGELNEPALSSPSLLPVVVTTPCEMGHAVGEVETKEQLACGGAIYIEFPGSASIRVESGADPVLLRSVLESLHK